MAEKPQQTKGKGGAPGAGGGKKSAAPAGATDPAPKSRVATPRFQTLYQDTIRPRLAKSFGLDNPNQVPRIVKIVLNVGLGEGSKNPKLIDAVADEFSLITGQRPVVTKAKKAIANFNLRQGMPVGVMVTLRGARMYEFLDRFITLALPRTRDFRGLPDRSFDGQGNYTFGIKEQLIFPEIDYDKVEKIHGMDITVVTSTDRDDLAMALLKEFGWPFRVETPSRAA
ncbi:MAG: 50S ribosomal protein L5 [Gemmatimonadota bacterium]